jgi:hypothetical protein
MGEFHRNLDAFITPRRINQALDPRLLRTPLHQLSRDDQVKLRTAILVAKFLGASDCGGPYSFLYEGIDVSLYGSMLAPYEATHSNVIQDEIYI